ncbi:DNA ligase D [Xanthomonas campestris]|uniref:DNA ligase D n=1 Tax=Xanthomonas campestris TaxID=339 RepID=UPI0023781BBB|nr:DNA ligase D [Xanthomonas campestris]MEA9806566.1 DNA ligase D [Xanthomonas campestris pv. raphani]WDL16202.1 DNA ligase D [Xanthomonas campestris pv. campestris]WDL20283.1 DNA ligase D [Xanthomonas campestris pv. campestris]WDL27640.1 DNA ligase D [Xanthomonas campestris pv. campestris]WDL28449.1 DNA ligase D [Xanthomonas campestris pv. campestris]
MSLSEYRRKRSFDKTREPEPGKLLPQGQRAIFVVQLHHASRRHYDFRLQVGDALKSWAVPKGPSYDPAVKRMAVEVEDHPVDYARFEGEIPKGEYGGGHVAQFDHGVWATAGDPEAQLAKGHLRFELFGSKLKGGWHLVRSSKPARQPQWLLFKEDDAYAGTLEADDLLADVAAAPAEDVRRAGAGKAQRKALTTVPVPRARARNAWTNAALKLTHARRGDIDDAAFAPQLAKLGQAPPDGAQWVHEIKWDGYRILATVTDGQVRLWSRNALEWTDKIPDIRDAIQALNLRSARLDGELIAGRGTKEDFNLLQATLSGERQVPLALAVFDLLHIDGVEISEAPLRERKQLLQQVLANAPAGHLAYSSHVEGDGLEAFRVAGEQHFEGIISKRADRPYRAGRSDDWRKTKQLASQEYAVVGYTAPKGSRTGFGSLLLATPDPQHGWLYVGRVGSGFSDTLMQEVTQHLHGGGKRPTAHIPTEDTDLRGATWFAPRFVVEVFYRGIGGQQLLRQASLKAVRLDKDIADLADSDTGDVSPAQADVADTPALGHKRANKQAPAPGELTLSSPTKLIYPDIRATKGDVWDYYHAVMDHLLPEIVGRPLSIIRCPNGAEKPCFFQKHHTAGLERVSSVRLKEETGSNAYYLVVEDAPGLLELVQFNALEFHPWGSHAARPDMADRVVFDLDPGPDVPFAEVKRAATDIRKLLAQLELESFLRVSGGKGLHVVVPLNPGCDWELTKRFAKGFADALAQSEPDRFVATATKRFRNKRIFVDYLRNGRGATAVASYSLRGRPGAPVALPLPWSDLAKLHRANAFTLRDVPDKLRRRRKDPWADIAQIQQNLARWADQG